MFTIKSPDILRKKLKKLKQSGKKIGFVPTMGFLHEGHLSLIRKAKKENDIVVVSIFVNPTQFGPNEDYGSYPRNIRRDKMLLKKEKVDFVFIPSKDDMYSKEHSVYVVDDIYSNILCGKFRKGHFRGVLTIVLKLFNIVMPDAAYFGQKDFQQAFLIKKMVLDLNLDVKIRVCPIVREKDGLAMSSRNIYLNNSERERALGIYKTLKLVVNNAKKGMLSVKKLKNFGKRNLKKYVDKIDYLEIVKKNNLEFVDKLNKKVKYVVLCAAYVGKARLIDNLIFRL